MKAISIALIFVLLAGAQQHVQTPVPAPQTAAAGIVKFQANTQLVIETVTVRDKNGKPVAGLTAKDFTITEDGVAPAPKLTAHPFSVTKNRTATFRFTDARRGVRFQFLNGNKYQSITSPKVFRHLSFRVHTFSVRAIDSHGTSRVTTFTWRVKR